MAALVDHRDYNKLPSLNDTETRFQVSMSACL